MDIELFFINVIIIIIIIIIKWGRQCNTGREEGMHAMQLGAMQLGAMHPISSKTAAPQYLPKERKKRKGKQ